MGESDEATPIVLVRGLRKNLLRNTEYPSARFAIPMEECVYMRSLGLAGPEKLTAPYAFKHPRSRGRR
jgi:F420-0:gamma-glutamyl ligase